MSDHTTKVTPVRRRAHDIERIVLVVRCTGCTFRFECLDDIQARRAGKRHEAAQTADVVAAEVES